MKILIYIEYRYDKIGSHEEACLLASKALSLSTSESQKRSSLIQLAFLYSNLGKYYLARTTFEDVLNNYISEMSYLTTDVYSGKIKDNTLGQYLYYIALTSGILDLPDTRKYFINAAQCGHEDAIDRCKDSGWQY